MTAYADVQNINESMKIHEFNFENINVMQHKNYNRENATKIVSNTYMNCKAKFQAIFPTKTPHDEENNCRKYLKVTLVIHCTKFPSLGRV